MNKHANYITNRLKLRDPQKESLQIFERICDQLDLSKEADLTVELEKMKKISSTFTDFERDFPSICFSLATGVGKTRLMGAFIAYLYYEMGISNFFVMAPNLTIYKKLIDDFGNVNNPKYVFRGLDAFFEAPRIIDGDNYEDFRMQDIVSSKITINIFNISKLNAESKGTKGKPARIKRLNEVLGESYFDYLVSLSDLVLLMDESHHYTADRGMTVINELKPILGIEVTATPQIQKGGKKIPFKNVVYEYSLARALEDGKFIKIPAVATQINFIPEQYANNPKQLDQLKLRDGINIHNNTKIALEVYSRENGVRTVKPFVLVVAKDTTHSKEILEYIRSESFFKGDYKDKVVEVNSNQSGIEKDENISQLLSVEDPKNNIEIVIHVNMLKEGWDVNNLYTIIPLRTSASDTLTEQTIGRGLRLPYGKRTGVDAVDTLTIVSHDKYAEIIKLANDPNSLVRRIYTIDPNENPEQDGKEVVEQPSRINEVISSPSFLQQLTQSIPDTIIPNQEKKEEVATFISQTSYETVMGFNKMVKSFTEIRKPENQQLLLNAVLHKVKKEFPTIEVDQQVFIDCAKKTVDEISQMVTDIVIPIPQATVQQKLEIVEGFHLFDLDVRNIRFYPSDETIVIKELTKEGRVTTIKKGNEGVIDEDTPINSIIKEIILSRSDVDYEKNAELLYSLMNQLQDHFRSYLSEDDMNKVLKQRRKDIADLIYTQMSQHFYKEETRFEAGEMRPFSKIEIGYAGKYVSDEIYDFRVSFPASEVPKKMFKGFRKSCHTLYKFDSNTEKILAIILEEDDAVEKWLRPFSKQFKLYWDKQSKHQYEPDFIVETSGCIYMIETKDKNDIPKDEVQLKARAGIEYCKAATEFNEKHGGKPWKYVLIPHDMVQDGRSFNWLVQNYTKSEI